MEVTPIVETEAFFERDEEGNYLPTSHTEGPWDARFQHGGPCAALLTRAIEQGPVESLGLARVTFEILGPVPMVPLQTSVSLKRSGRRISLIHATLSADEKPLMIASAWMIQSAPDDLPINPIPVYDLPTPDQLVSIEPMPHPSWYCGFLRATEWRFVRGDYLQSGPATAWVRPKMPLIGGEQMSPAQRVALAADSANGVSAALPIDEWIFIPPELTIHFLRPAVGEWLCLDAESFVQPGSVGLATAAIRDLHGPVAKSSQSLLIARRDTKR